MCSVESREGLHIYIPYGDARNTQSVPFIFPYVRCDDPDAYVLLDLNVKSIFYVTSELTPLLAKDATNLGKLKKSWPSGGAQ
jgi:hypothetical protein